MAEAVDLKYGNIRASRKEFNPAEPVVVIRSTDPLGPRAVRMYARLCLEMGCSIEHVNLAYDAADAMEKWQSDNQELVKVRPD